MRNAANTSLDRTIRHLIKVSLVIALAAGAALAGSTHLSAPAGMQETVPPTRIPLRKFFANPAGTFSYKVSPDGRRLAWLQGDAGRLTIFYQTIGEGDIRIIDTHSPRAIFWFTWAQDSRRLLYTQDQNGDENYHVYLADTEHPQQPPVDPTPFERTRAWIHQVMRADPGHVIIAHNQRDPTVFDLYRLNLSSQEQTRIAENPGDVLAWATDRDGHVRARIRHLGPDERRLEVWQAGRQAWMTRLSLGIEDVVRVWGFTADGSGMWLTSNVGRDRIALVRLDLDSEQIIRPVLVVHGANDARVKQQESDQMVAALRQAGKDVDYLLIADEGQGSNYGNYRNRLRL